MKARFAYAQARLQARYALLLDTPAWQHLHASRSLSSFLEEARGTALEQWISGLSLVSDPHHIEQALQQRWHQLILQASTWMPENWRDAVLWIAWVTELPLLDLLLRQPAVPPWARQAPLLGPLLVAAEKTPGGLAERLAQTPAAALLPPPGHGGSSLEARWLAHWRQLWPPLAKTHRANLERLIGLLGKPCFAEPSLSQPLRHLFRRAPLQPAALFSWLVLTLREYRLLRGALITRAIFANASGAG
jgi:hypothetical protein